MDLLQFELFLTRKGLHPTTRGNYLVAMQAFAAQYPTFTLEHVDRFILHKIRTISSAGVNKYVKTFRKYFEFIGMDPPDTLRCLKEKPKSRIILSDEEIQQLIECDPPPSTYGAFWACLAFTGARPMEIAHLTREDVDLQNNVIYIHESKTGESRKVPILAALREYIFDYISTSQTRLLFPLAHKKGVEVCLSHAAYMKDWKKRLKEIGITRRVQPYSLRHSFITDTLGNGANLFEIGEMVGQKNSETTKRYYHGNIQLMRKAASNLSLARKKEGPATSIDQLIELIDGFLGNDTRYNKEEILEAKKHLYRSIQDTSP
jgi:integrase